ncbi:hypothetical protein DPM19_12320 [Actinomadura craniellae]|uniref:Uncharacterized protein n=1 Tax=Actinomadura craniellae TaxID=2231787 RepID=A0A365H649_9ACTN|nr:hypothetical protein [Actinomadura craniellae]RAY14557.1 hypothetical protein DPM19_12320 [Actinomadura craniellae]
MIRIPNTRLLGVIAVGSALFVSATACGFASNTAACNDIKKEVQSLSSSASTLVSNPAAAATAYSDTATKVRDHGKKAGGDVETAANKLATELDNLANTLRAASSGTPRMPNTTAYINAAKQVDAACS